MFPAVISSPRAGRRLGRGGRGARIVPRRSLMLLALLAVAAVAALTPAARAGAAPGPPLVVPPAAGLYNGLAVAWWKYALGQPLATNPLIDATGANCEAGQAGPVFFLTGLPGTGAVTRDGCTVRGTKALFFPLMNAFDVHTPVDGLDTPELTYKDFRSFGFHADTLRATVDGVAIPNLDPASTPFRACAAPVAGCAPASFSLTFPAPNLFGLPADRYEPAVQDGYYLLLAPLRPGLHTIAFGGTGTFGGTRADQDIVYHLRVLR
jgi:hypothetical protein